MALFSRATGNKQITAILALFLLIYIISDCYLFNASISLFALPRCAHPVPSSLYYRNQFVGSEPYNFSFYVWNIQIGKLFIERQGLSQFEIHNLSKQIKRDMLHWNHSTTEKKGALRRDLFSSYFDELHHPELLRQDEAECIGPPSAAPPALDEAFDFFDFLHFDHEHLLSNSSLPTNPMGAANTVEVNWYDMLPIEDFFNGTYWTAETAHSALSREYLFHRMAETPSFYLPVLCTYAIAVDVSGFLPSLELRIGEIVHPKQQHNMMKHLNLNNNVKHLLWAGELYAVYDHKYGRYVVIMDNASGHWKPDANRFPRYLWRILMDTVFPGHAVPVDHQALSSGPNDTGYHFVDYYRPFVTVGFYDEPFHALKKVQFPIISEIKVFEREHRAIKRRNKARRERREERERLRREAELRRNTTGDDAEDGDDDDATTMGQRHEHRTGHEHQHHSEHHGEHRHH